MSDVIAKAPPRANKATPKAKAVPSPAPAPAVAAPAPAQPSAQDEGPTVDEQLVAATLRQQLMAIYHAPGNDLHSDSSELVHAAAEALANLSGGAYVALYRACALVGGAVAVERTASPESAAVAQLQAVRQSLDTASISYNCEMERGEEMAEGIRAGQRQFRDRPTPPIQRVEAASRGPYSQTQLFTVLTEVASVALTLSDVLALAGQSKDEWHMRTLIDSANVHARLLGAMADTASGCNMRGDHDAWIYGPNFANEGKAGAA
ncbi:MULTISPECIES: hypothetical protein [unclassified Acidovorax]|uniref:hypothetical protein n=1 Tax=unclassified Acidovorax TaxID=2684926 RepID=UPI001C485E88|nr:MULTISPECIES: hypothetical protein [unclassified Acidovorax]MBV7428088.1 hypothetical protein [Acidovorax sp. sif0732]MBV7449345.1 hypothetical protein [Acidovorax sp. sif0715]